MSIVRTVSTQDSTTKKSEDPGLDELFRFIKAGLTGDNNRKRVLRTDKEYSFTIRTKRHGGSTERHIVTIATGQSLHFVKRSGSEETDIDQFMVNVDGHGWRVNGATGVVRYFANEIRIRDDTSSQLVDITKGVSLSRR